MSDLTDRIAVVTGASRGIGRSIALELGARGATVIVNYNRSADAAQGVVDAIIAAGGQAHAFQADVSEEEAANALIETTVKEHGKIDILVNNAGTTKDNVIMRLNTDDFDSIIKTNLRSAWILCKAVIRPMMRKRFGRIVNITSVSGIMGQVGQTNYSASKAGLIGLTKSLAREYAARNITVNAVAPGFVATDLTADIPKDLQDQTKTLIPMGRWGEAEEIAKAVAFLASEDAGYITGQVLAVDGGLAM
jgi:3-oxoacyl-[acyl-carrier protein] reductase